MLLKMNWLKRLILFRLIIIVIQLKKKVDYDTKTEDIEKKITINDNYINTDEFNK